MHFKEYIFKYHLQLNVIEIYYNILLVNVLKLKNQFSKNTFIYRNYIITKIVKLEQHLLNHYHKY